jgi:hypothetical protein
MRLPASSSQPSQSSKPPSTANCLAALCSKRLPCHVRDEGMKSGCEAI